MNDSDPPEDALGPLSELDELIASMPHGPLTLNPDASRASSLVALVSRLSSPEQRPTLALGAHRVVAALIESFPGNLFWDFDYLLASVHRGALEDGDYASGVGQRVTMLAELMGLYGRESVIRFRYAHDFVYGFDWARWVRRDPAQRAQMAPFDLAFIRQSKNRGHHLMQLIAADDERYPRLRGEEARNPFPFAREPEQELRLWPLLAAQDSIPVRAWELDPTPVWDRDFDALREEAAEALGF